MLRKRRAEILWWFLEHAVQCSTVQPERGVYSSAHVQAHAQVQAQVQVQVHAHVEAQVQTHVQAHVTQNTQCKAMSGKIMQCKTK